jgi:hypothetical protein
MSITNRVLVHYSFTTCLLALSLALLDRGMRRISAQLWVISLRVASNEGVGYEVSEMLPFRANGCSLLKLITDE